MQSAVIQNTSESARVLVNAAPNKSHDDALVKRNSTSAILENASCELVVVSFQPTAILALL